MQTLCTQCGLSIDEKGSFCTSCGTKLRQDSVTTRATSQVGTQGVDLIETKPAIPAPRGKAKVLLAGLGALLLFGGVAVAGVVYVGYRANSKAKEIRSVYKLDAILNQTSHPAAPEGDSEKSSKSGLQRDACALITKEEIAAATGAAISGGTSGDDGEACTFEASDDSAVTVVVNVKWHGGSLAMNALPAMSQQPVQEDIRKLVKGIGDEAYLLGVDEETQKSLDKASPELKALTGFASGPLTFRKGEAWVVITATLSENKTEVEKKIAAIIAGRM
jgi:hypothetical protein